MKSKVNFKLGWKQTVIMLLAMLLFLLVFFWVTGYLKINANLGDVCSLSSSKTIAESDHWELHQPGKEGKAPFLTYKGKLESSPHVMGSGHKTDEEGNVSEKEDIVRYSARITINGDLLYTRKDSEEVKTKEIYQHVYPDRHFFVGQQRWYLDGYSDKKITEASFAIRWQDGDEEYTEKLEGKN